MAHARTHHPGGEQVAVVPEHARHTLFTAQAVVFGVQALDRRLVGLIVAGELSR